MKRTVIPLKCMQFACLIILFVEISSACDNLVSTSTTGPFTSIENKAGCLDYSTFLKRDICAEGDKFETQWHVNLKDKDGTCLNKTTQLRKCEGDCGEKLNLLGKVNLTCSEGYSICPFKYEVRDCFPKVEWVEVSSCDGTSTHAKRVQKCMDCDNNEIDKKFCEDLEEEVTVCENSDDYTLWKAGSCSFTYPSCKPTIVQTRECKAATKESKPALCSNEYVRLEISCKLSYNCCECTDKALCPDCHESFNVPDKSGDSIADETTAPSSSTSDGSNINVETDSELSGGNPVATNNSEATTSASSSSDETASIASSKTTTETSSEDTNNQGSGESGARKGPSIGEVGAQDSNTNTAAAVTVPLVFVFAIAGAAAAFMYKKKVDQNKIGDVFNETDAPLPEDNI